jgi:hypothetical protein
VSDEVLVPVPCPMTRAHAFMLGVQMFGDGATVGENQQHPEAPFYVGAKELGEWTKIGFGRTWEEAFDNVKEVLYQRANQTFVFKDERK